MCIKNLKVKFPNLKYISIGDGDEKNRLESLKKELNLKEEVLFLHKVNEQLKVALLNKSNLSKLLIIILAIPSVCPIYPIRLISSADT